MSKFNTSWTLPENAILNLTDAEEVAQVANDILGFEVNQMFPDPNQIPVKFENMFFNTATIRIAFTAIKTVLDRRNRLQQQK